MRVTENLRFLNTSHNLNEIKSRYETIVEKMSSQKKINRLSDDPLGVASVISGRKTLAAIGQHERNINHARAFLDLTETALTAVGEMLTRAQELTIAGATGTATSENRSIAAKEISEINQGILSQANSSYDGRHLFAGTKTNKPPFSLASSAAAIFPAAAGQTNSFDGTATSGGVYVGQTNKTFLLRITQGGGMTTAQYQISADGGRTWGAAATGLVGPVNLGDGAEISFAAGTVDFAANDTFTVEAKAAGHYYGNSENLSLAIGPNSTWSYNVTGDTAFGGAGAPAGVDIFALMKDLEAALRANDTPGIQTAIGHLQTAQNQILQAVAETGARMNRLENAQTQLADLKFETTKAVSRAEDADMVDLIVLFTNNEAALKASYQVASRIGGMSILDFLR